MTKDHPDGKEALPVQLQEPAQGQGPAGNLPVLCCKAPGQRYVVLPGLRIPAQPDGLSRGGALPALHRSLGSGPWPLLPDHLVHLLEPLLRLRPAHRQLPALQPQPHPAHLHGPPVLLRGPQGRARGAAAPAQGWGTNCHHDLQRFLLLLEHICGEQGTDIQRLGRTA